MNKLLLSIFLLIGINSFSQLNDSTRYFLNVASTGSYQVGNFDRFQSINKLEFQVQSNNLLWEFSTDNLYMYQTVFGNKTQDDILSRNFITRRLTDRFNLFTAFFYEKQWIKRVEQNAQIGLGARYILVKNRKGFLTVGVMGSYFDKRYAGTIFNDFDNQGSASLDGFYITSVIKTQYQIVPKRLIGQLNAWAQLDPSEQKNWRYVVNASLIAPIYKGFSMKLNVMNFYENINLTGVEPNDWMITYGVNFKLLK